MQQNNSLNLIEVVAAIKKSSNQIIVFVFLSLAIAYSVLLLIPKYFQSTAIVVAANPALADKARFFNNNIQGLYSNFGSGDDLDRIYGLANLDTAYKLLVDEFELISYYQLNDDSIKLRRRKAVLLLKDDIQLSKTDLSQLKISVWHKDNKTSAAIALATSTTSRQAARSSVGDSQRTKVSRALSMRSDIGLSLPYSALWASVIAVRPP